MIANRLLFCVSLAALATLVPAPVWSQEIGAEEDAGGLTPPAPLGQELPATDPERRPASFTNLSDEPFRFRLRRCRGACWTDEFVIEPGETRQLLDGVDREDILGLGRGVGVPYVVVQYPQAPGYIRLKLTGRTGPEREILMPYYYFVRDNNGFGRMLHAPDVEAAKRQEADLLKEPKLNAGERGQLYSQAIASGILYIPQMDPPAWEWPPIGPGGIRADSLIDGPVYYSYVPYGPVFVPGIFGLVFGPPWGWWDLPTY